MQKVELDDTDVLATAIYSVALRLGIIKPGTALTGPQCVNLLRTIEEMAALVLPVQGAPEGRFYQDDVGLLHQIDTEVVAAHPNVSGRVLLYATAQPIESDPQWVHVQEELPAPVKFYCQPADSVVAARWESGDLIAWKKARFVLDEAENRHGWFSGSTPLDFIPTHWASLPAAPVQRDSNADCNHQFSKQAKPVAEQKPCGNALQCSHPSKCSHTGKCQKQLAQSTQPEGERKPCRMCGATVQARVCATLPTCPMNQPNGE